MEGWITLQRKFLEHWLCDEYRPLTKREAWENMLFYANFKDSGSLIKGQLIECKRGQIIYSIETYAKKFNWSTGQVRQFFKLLENDKMIKVEGLKYTTRITICNYDEYQNQQRTDNELTTNSQLTDNELTTTSEERKESKLKKSRKRVKANIENENDSFNFYKSEVDKAKQFPKDDACIDYIKLCNEICTKLPDGTWRMPDILKMKNPLSLAEFTKLYAKANKDLELIKSKVISLQTNVTYHNKYQDMYYTINNWLNPRK